MGVLLAAVALLFLAVVLVIDHAVPQEAETPAARPAKAGSAARDLTPREFEQHCADALAARGWSVTVGRGSADQGVDVLARKNGRKVVLQCKLWNRPVGNKAVQEALAGKGYAGADGAAVVSNAAYTAAAHALAARVGVLLLHVSDLSRADTLFQFPASPEPVPGPVPEAEPARARRRRAKRVDATWRPALRLPLRPIPAAVVAGVILLFPRLPAERTDAPEPRRIARPALPLPPPAPPLRQASR